VLAHQTHEVAIEEHEIRGYRTIDYTDQLFTQSFMCAEFYTRHASRHTVATMPRHTVKSTSGRDIIQSGNTIGYQRTKVTSLLDMDVKLVGRHRTLHVSSAVAVLSNPSKVNGNQLAAKNSPEDAGAVKQYMTGVDVTRSSGIYCDYPADLEIQQLMNRHAVRMMETSYGSSTNIRSVTNTDAFSLALNSIVADMNSQALQGMLLKAGRGRYTTVSLLHNGLRKLMSNIPAFLTSRACAVNVDYYRTAFPHCDLTDPELV